MLATYDEAMKERATNVGHEARYIGRQWILSDYDVWVRNPYYTGPEQPHPETVEWDDVR